MIEAATKKLVQVPWAERVVPKGYGQNRTRHKRAQPRAFDFSASGCSLFSASDLELLRGLLEVTVFLLDFLGYLSNNIVFGLDDIPIIQRPKQAADVEIIDEVSW